MIVTSSDPSPRSTGGAAPGRVPGGALGAPRAGSGGPPTGPGPTQPPEPGRVRKTGRTIGWTLALALLVFVTVVLVLFVVFNTQTVQISLVFGDVAAPLVLALLGAAVLGGLVVWLAGMVMRARRRNR